MGAHGLPVKEKILILALYKPRPTNSVNSVLYHELSWYLAYFKLNFRAEDTVPSEIFQFSIEKLSPIVALKKTKLVFTNHTNTRSEIAKTNEALL